MAKRLLLVGSIAVFVLLLVDPAAAQQPAPLAVHPPSPAAATVLDVNTSVDVDVNKAVDTEPAAPGVVDASAENSTDAASSNSDDPATPQGSPMDDADGVVEAVERKARLLVYLPEDSDGNPQPKPGVDPGDPSRIVSNVTGNGTRETGPEAGAPTVPPGERAQAAAQGQAEPSAARRGTTPEAPASRTVPEGAPGDGGIETAGDETSPVSGQYWWGSADLWFLGGPSLAIALLLAAWLRTRLPGLRHIVPLAAGLTRISSHNALKNPVRRQVLQMVEADPGVTIKQVAETMNLDRTTAAYHLRVLQRFDFVTSKTLGRNRHYFCRVDDTDVRACAELQNETSRSIYDHIRGEPGAFQKRVCDALGLSPSRAHTYFQRLHKAGLISRARDGRTVRYFAADDAPRGTAGVPTAPTVA